MGRAASHITLECALQTHPNITLIGEEVPSLSSLTILSFLRVNSVLVLMHNITREESPRNLVRTDCK